MTAELNKDSLKQWQEGNCEILRYRYPGVLGTLLDIGSYHREWGAQFPGYHVEYFDALDNRAAWLYDGEIRMGGAHYYTSMLLPATDTYQCVDIAPFIKDIAIMKINVEGGEYELLDYIISKGLHAECQHIQVQFHMVAGIDWQARYEAIAKQLSLTHRLTWRYPFCWENWERIC